MFIAQPEVFMALHMHENWLRMMFFEVRNYSLIDMWKLHHLQVNLQRPSYFTRQTQPDNMKHSPTSTPLMLLVIPEHTVLTEPHLRYQMDKILIEHVAQYSQIIRQCIPPTYFRKTFGFAFLYSSAYASVQTPLSQSLSNNVHQSPASFSSFRPYHRCPRKADELAL
ncbi:hypothetical protein AC579_58 [Pseudocercospora musae]|uniref:Uncharacterized protein n=1 Tax=Pseudocercospora musae TaxID=113226 RepID=A0A139IAR2_9PEZI|nr:hypothetical protein AC579_58 [Pseudocercospora musae]